MDYKWDEISYYPDKLLDKLNSIAMNKIREHVFENGLGNTAEFVRGIMVLMTAIEESIKESLQEETKNADS